MGKIEHKRNSIILFQVYFELLINIYIKKHFISSLMFIMVLSIMYINCSPQLQSLFPLIMFSFSISPLFSF